MNEFNLKDYNRWAEEFKQEGGEPSIKRYLKHLIYKEANLEPKHIKRSQHEKTEDL